MNSGVLAISRPADLPRRSIERAPGTRRAPFRLAVSRQVRHHSPMATNPTSNADRLLETLSRTLVGLVKNGGRGLTTCQLAVFLVCYHETEPQTVRGLAERLNTYRAEITRAFDRLEEAGLMRRKADPSDRRSVFATRTAAGNTFLRELKQIMADAAMMAEHFKGADTAR